MLNGIKELIQDIKSLGFINNVKFEKDKLRGFENVANQIYIYEPKGQEYAMVYAGECGLYKIGINYVLIAKFDCMKGSEMIKILMQLVTNLENVTNITFSLDESEIYKSETGQDLGTENNMIRIRFRLTEMVDISCIGVICEPCC